MELETGQEYSVEHTVSENDTALAHKSGGLAVYATPAMAALMEEAAYLLLRECGFESVGTQLNISHTRACLCGAVVKAVAKVAGIEGRKLTFRVEACDSKGPIGEGDHTRYVIDPEKFMSKLQ